MPYKMPPQAQHRLAEVIKKYIIFFFKFINIIIMSRLIPWTTEGTNDKVYQREGE